MGERRLSEDERERVRKILLDFIPHGTEPLWALTAVDYCRKLLAELDAVRAELVAARRERDALKAALASEGSATCICAACRWAFHDEQPPQPLPDAAVVVRVPPREPAPCGRSTKGTCQICGGHIYVSCEPAGPAPCSKCDGCGMYGGCGCTRCGGSGKEPGDMPGVKVSVKGE